DSTAATTEAPAAVPAADYEINASASTLFVIVRRDPGTIGASFAHDHAVGATGWSGTVHWDPSNVAACAISIKLPVSGLRVDPPGYRAKAGIDPEGVSDSDEAKITDNFRSDSQLDMGSYPEIAFQSTSCAGADGKYVVSGNMTMRGKSRPTKIPMSITADGSTLKASGKFDANHTDWGFNPFSAAFGSVKNLNELTFVIDVTAAKS
ncbi:MAG: YceI family protein, partial [Deltaproteobacteria bacterium]|nr:YceI family protein [Deltaproteobacteria bacterium]